MRLAVLLAALSLAACENPPNAPPNDADTGPNQRVPGQPLATTDIPPEGELRVQNPSVQVGPVDGEAQVVFEVVNNGPADVLRGATSDVGTAQLRRLAGGPGGDASNAVTELPVPAGQVTSLSDARVRVWLSDLDRELAPGDQVRLTVQFERRGAVEVVAPVGQPIPGQAGPDVTDMTQDDPDAVGRQDR